MKEFVRDVGIPEPTQRALRAADPELFDRLLQMLRRIRYKQRCELLPALAKRRLLDMRSEWQRRWRTKVRNRRGHFKV